jgi:hypothetical protein
VIETHTIPAANFDRLLRRLQQPGRYCPRIARVLSTPAPWETERDITLAPRRPMTTEHHPITPPLELLKQWEDDFRDPPGFCDRDYGDLKVTLARAYQAGADQELEACCRQLTDPEWYDEIKNLRGPFRAAELRAARRPKPPSLKEQALKALDEMQIEPCIIDGVDINAAVRTKYNTIRRALEQLPND